MESQVNNGTHERWAASVWELEGNGYESSFEKKELRFPQLEIRPRGV